MKDEIIEAQKAGEAAGEARGEARGELKAKQENALELYNRKMPVEVIADIIKVNLDIVNGWFSETPTIAR